MSKTAPGPKELAQRAMQEKRVAKGRRRLIPYAGKPPGGQSGEHLYGVKSAVKRKKPK